MPFAPNRSIIPQFNQQTGPISPEEQALQDELAKRAQAQLPAWKQSAISGIDQGGDFLRGMFSIPDNKYPVAKKWGALVGSLLPYLGAAKYGKGVEGAGEMIEHGPLTQPAQTLYDHLMSINSQVSPETLAKSAASSRVTRIKGNPPSRIVAPEGFQFNVPQRARGMSNGRLLQDSVPAGPTPATDAFKQWYKGIAVDKEFKPSMANAVPAVRSPEEINDVMGLALAKRPDGTRVAPVVTNRGTLGQVQGGLKRANVSIDTIRKIRAFPSANEARAAFPDLSRDQVGAIYRRESFPGVK